MAGSRSGAGDDAGIFWHTNNKEATKDVKRMLMRLTDQKWDNLKFSKDKNVSGSKSTEYIKIYKLKLVSVNVYLWGKPKEMKKIL